MTKQIVQRKTINKIIKDNYRKHLSIQFSLDGLSFCISNLITKEIQNLGSYTFDKTMATPKLLLNKIESLILENNLFEQEFESITAIHQNNLSTLVPSPLFNENELNLYLDYNIKTLTTDFIAFDNLSQLEIKNVYIPYVNINNFLFQKFGEFEYKHHATILIDKLILHSKNKSSKQFFVNVSKHNLDIAVIANSKLIFYNSFLFYTKEDFIYYILFTAEQLQLNPENFLLYFIGRIEPDCELYKITYKYVRNVNFLSIETTFFDNDSDVLSYSHYIIIP